MNGLLYGRDYGMGSWLEFTTLPNYGVSPVLSGMGDTMRATSAPGVRLASVAPQVGTLGKVVLAAGLVLFVVTMWPR